MTSTQTITPTLFFSGGAAKTQDIIAFYASVFKDFEVIYQITLPEGPVEGKVLARVKMNGLECIFFDGGHDFEFSEGLSLTIDCQSQEEVDYYWEKLSDGGKPMECGWLRDRFGVFWQIVPTRMMELMQDSNRQKAANVFNAMLTMQKMDIAKLERAFENDPALR
ncbi:MAG: VOC family protein [Vampirovibrionales bacterium]|nr:VOC family protein [Vampirovibrionales bacterium]